MAGSDEHGRPCALDQLETSICEHLGDRRRNGSFRILSAAIALRRQQADEDA
jgi:hypothetical protein